MIQCKKCGGTSIVTTYDTTTDMLKRACTCGYMWKDYPMDAGYRKEKDIMDLYSKLPQGKTGDTK